MARPKKYATANERKAARREQTRRHVAAYRARQLALEQTIIDSSNNDEKEDVKSACSRQ